MRFLHFWEDLLRVLSFTWVSVLSTIGLGERFTQWDIDMTETIAKTAAFVAVVSILATPFCPFMIVPFIIALIVLAAIFIFFT